MQPLESATIYPSAARWLRGTAAVVVILAAPAVSGARAFTTGLSGTASAVRFPRGFWVALLVTAAVTPLAAHLARRDALVVILVTLGLWAITGAAAFSAGVQLGRAGLAQWGVLTVVASAAGIAAGVILAARREEHHEHAT